MSETDPDDLVYLNEAKVATVVWLQYDGDRTDLNENYLLMNRDKDLGAGLAALGGKVEQHDKEQAYATHGDDCDLDAIAEQNAYRETREEAQIDSLYDMEQIGRVYNVSRPDGTFDEPWVIYHFTASTDEEPDSMEHREGDLAWYHPEELPDQSYAFRHDAFIENILEDEPFTALVDDIEDNGTFDEEATILHSTTGLMDWPDEDYLEQDLITAPETVKEHYFQEK